MAAPLGPSAVHAVYGFCRLAGLALPALLGLMAVLRGRTLEQILHDALIIFLAYCLLAAPWFQPWYVSWLLPLALVERNAELRHTLAIYSVLIVAQYALPADPLSVVAVNLWTLHRLARRQVTPPNHISATISNAPRTMGSATCLRSPSKRDNTASSTPMDAK